MQSDTKANTRWPVRGDSALQIGDLSVLEDGSKRGGALVSDSVVVEADRRARRQATPRDGGREILNPLLRNGVALEAERLHACQAALVKQGEKALDEAIAQLASAEVDPSETRDSRKQLNQHAPLLLRHPHALQIDRLRLARHRLLRQLALVVLLQQLEELVAPFVPPILLLLLGGAGQLCNDCAQLRMCNVAGPRRLQCVLHLAVEYFVPAELLHDLRFDHRVVRRHGRLRILGVDCLRGFGSRDASHPRAGGV